MIILDLYLFMVIGGIAWSGSVRISESYLNPPTVSPLECPPWAGRPTGLRFITIFNIAMIVLPFLNGYILGGVLGMFGSIAGTWVVMKLVRYFFTYRFEYAIRVFFFGSAYVIWTLVNLGRL